MATKVRNVAKSILAAEQSEGVGARVRRSIGSSQLRNFDPFLMLDNFRVATPAGFPQHPHRGFETVTYIFPKSKGSMNHADFCGHRGTIRAGDVQWMTAGKGIVHSEIPSEDGEVCDGLQLWVNLPKAQKMVEPRYQELLSKDMPKAEKDGVKATIIAGKALGVDAKIFTYTPIHYIHYIMEPNSVLEHELPASWNAFLFTIQGDGKIGTDSTTHKSNYTLVLDQGGDLIKIVAGESGFEFVLVAGQPIGEPIVQYGPFVMDSIDKIQEAFRDYQTGRNGFERAADWVCPISKR